MTLFESSRTKMNLLKVHEQKWTKIDSARTKMNQNQKYMDQNSA